MQTLSRDINGLFLEKRKKKFVLIDVNTLLTLLTLLFIAYIALKVFFFFLQIFLWTSFLHFALFRKFLSLAINCFLFPDVHFDSVANFLSENRDFSINFLQTLESLAFGYWYIDLFKSIQTFVNYFSDFCQQSKFYKSCGIQKLDSNIKVAVRNVMCIEICQLSLIVTLDTLDEKSRKKH